MFNISDRVTELRMERGWSEYHLSEQSGIVQSTISSWSRSKVMPTIANLEKVCNAFGITLSQFFAGKGETTVSLTDRQLEMLNSFDRLAPEQQNHLVHFLTSL